jgi:hypothetical protein
VAFAVVNAGNRPALGVDIKLAAPGEKLRVVLQEDATSYYLVRGDELLAVNLDEERVDRGVYLVLAELAQQ